ncbi:MAG TPA: multicopper oxidase family protein, partial [Micromonosporaceae bacterium]|nr:multicopper oxidase family protein [Micromonosporaceae bacterium]
MRYRRDLARPRFARRTFLRSGVALAGATATGGVLAGCGEERPARDVFVGPDSDRIRAVEAARRGGRTVSARLVAAPDEIDLGGPIVSTWTFGGRLPGRELRLSVGSVLAVRLDNTLPGDTTVHWHGVALRNDADGVPGVTQQRVRPGSHFDYRFTVSHPGTYWFHPHTGTQLDRGLYAPLIIEDPDEPLRYDDEWVVILDDWMDGVTGTPDDVFAELSRGMNHAGTGGMNHGMKHGDHGGGVTPSPSDPTSSGHALAGAHSELLGPDPGDVRYPYHLINGRVAAAPDSYRGRPGTRLRIRFVNAGADTAFRVALGGHKMTVTHTDGFPVEPFPTDALLLGMGERYDVLVTLGDGVFPLVGLAEGKDATALALVRTGAGSAPEVG